MYSNGNKNINGDDTTPNVYSEIIDILSKNISNNLERDLFKDLRATALIDAIAKTKQELLQSIKKTSKKDSGDSGYSSDSGDYDIANKNEELYKAQNLIFDRLLKEEEYMYVILALKTVNDVINKHNNHLLLPEQLAEQLKNYSIKQELNTKPKYKLATFSM